MSVSSTLKKLANKEKALAVAKYFKTGKGEYGEGDIFIGINSAGVSSVAKEYKDLPLEEIAELLKSKIHEERSCSLEILEMRYTKADPKMQKHIVTFYLANTAGINNWDLVDSSASYILGHYVFNNLKDEKMIWKLSKSKNMWERRISIVSMLHFVKMKSLDLPYKVAEALLKEKHDLMHKAVGWVLREAGKKDEKRMLVFLKKHYSNLARTTLRYAIERVEEKRRKAILLGKF